MNYICYRILTISGILTWSAIPVLAVSRVGVTGNATTPAGTGIVQEVVVTQTPGMFQPVSSSAGVAVPPVDPSLLVIAGVIIVIIAGIGLLYHYLYPKYVPPEEKK